MLPTIKVLTISFLIASFVVCLVACGANYISQSETITVIPRSTALSPAIPTITPTPTLTLTSTPSPTPTRAIALSPTPIIQVPTNQPTITLTIDTPSLIGQPGQKLTYILRFKNNGPVTDSLFVDIQVSQPGFYFDRFGRYDSTYIAPYVAPQQEHIEELNLMIPEYAPAGMSVTTLLQINGQETPLQFTTLVSVPTFIEMIEHIDHPAQAIAVTDHYAYLADGYNGLRILDISEPTHPIEIGLYDKRGGAWNVTIVEKYAYVIFGTCKVLGVLNEGRESNRCQTDLYVLDVSNPIAPVETNFYEIPKDAASMNDRWPKMITSGRYSYLIDGTGRLHILDISNPASPTKVNWPDQEVKDIALNNGYVYLLSPSNIKMGEGEIGFTHDSHLDILDSTSLSLIYVYRLPAETPTLGEVLIAGDRAYISWGVPCLKDCTIRSWLAVDISNPATPLDTDEIYNKEPIHLQDVAQTMQYVYIADGKAGLRILDISDPANPTEVDSFGAPGLALDVAVLDRYIYLANGSGGLYILRYNR